MDAVDLHQAVPAMTRGDLVALDGIGFGEEGAHIAHEISGYGWW
jgi:hypothetical protein